MKKITALILATALLSGFCGCAKNNPAIPSAPDVSYPPTSQAPEQTSVTKEVTQTPEKTEPKDYLQIGFDLINSESLGELCLHMTGSQLIAILGEPDKKEDPVIWGADGLLHSSWSYEKKGIEINMVKEPDKDEEAKIFSIRAFSPCVLQTKRGIKIGDKREDVIRAYSNEIYPNNSQTEGNIIIGSVYGGIWVAIEDGLISAIFIGASAE